MQPGHGYSVPDAQYAVVAKDDPDCRLVLALYLLHSAVIPSHLSGTPLALWREGALLGPNFLGGSQIRALPTALESSLPTLRMFISSTMTRKKSLFSRGSRWRTVGSLDMTLPASELGSTARERRFFCDRPRRS